MGRFFKCFGLPGNLVLTLLLSAFAVTLACLFRTAPRIICAPAMLLSSLGDIILMDYKPITDRLPFRGFTAGALTFGAAHLLYGAAYLTVIIRRGFNFINLGFFSGLVIFCLSAGLLVAMNAKSKKGADALLLPVAYLLLICFDCTIIFSCSASRGTYGIIAAVGATSFFISDMFIAFKVVGGAKIKHSDDIIWWFYPIGQILMLIGA